MTLRASSGWCTIGGAKFSSVVSDRRTVQPTQNGEISFVGNIPSFLWANGTNRVDTRLSDAQRFTAATSDATGALLATLVFLRKKVVGQSRSSLATSEGRACLCPFVRPASSPAVRPDGRDASRRSRAANRRRDRPRRSAVPRVLASPCAIQSRRLGDASVTPRITHAGGDGALRRAERRRGRSLASTRDRRRLPREPRPRCAPRRLPGQRRSPRRRPTRRPTRRPRMRTLKAARTTGSGSSIAADVAPDGGFAGATPRRAPR